MPQETIFISHIAEESRLAMMLKRFILEDFGPAFRVYVSSDYETSRSHNGWQSRLVRTLKKARVLLVLCSQRSLKHPWINFEAGAGWGYSVRVVPLCHSGLRPDDLPAPMGMADAFLAGEPSGLRAVYRLLQRLRAGHPSAPPSAPYAAHCAAIRRFEEDYRSSLLRAESDLCEPIPGNMRQFLTGRWTGQFVQAIGGVEVQHRVCIAMSVEGDRITGEGRVELDLDRDGRASFEFTAVGEFLFGRFFQFEYLNVVDGRQQFGHIVLKIDPVHGGRLEGKFVGYGPEFEAIVNGNVSIHHEPAAGSRKGSDAGNGA